MTYKTAIHFSCLSRGFLSDFILGLNISQHIDLACHCWAICCVSEFSNQVPLPAPLPPYQVSLCFRIAVYEYASKNMIHYDKFAISKRRPMLETSQKATLIQCLLNENSNHPTQYPFEYIHGRYSSMAVDTPFRSPMTTICACVFCIDEIIFGFDAVHRRA